MMDHEPEWALLERACLIKKGMAAALSKLHGLTPEQRSDAIEEVEQVFSPKP